MAPCRRELARLIVDVSRLGKQSADPELQKLDKKLARWVQPKFFMGSYARFLHMAQWRSADKAGRTMTPHLKKCSWRPKAGLLVFFLLLHYTFVGVVFKGITACEGAQFSVSSVEIKAEC